MEAAEDSAAPGPDAPPAVAPAPPKRAGVFSAMMDAQKRQKAADAAKAKEPLPKPKPRGPTPKGPDGQLKTWDPLAGPVEQHATHGPGIFTGRWTSPTDANPLPAPAPRGRPGEGVKWDAYAGPVKPHETHAGGICTGGWTSTSTDTPMVEGSEDSVVPVDESSEVAVEVSHATTKFRLFQESWLDVNPALTCIKCVGVGVCPSIRAEACTGCSGCSLLYCDTCIRLGLGAAPNSSKNPMREGTKDFRRRAVVAHRLQYHPSEQPSVVSAFEKSIDGLKKHVKTVMRSVYFLAKKNVAIRNVKDLVHLLRQSGAALGKAYVNDHAAADFVLALAHVVRAPIIAAAQAPRPKAVMMDESTDVSHSGNMIIYLRVFIKGKYTTVFWRILHVPDATALGLFTALAAAFEMDGIPTSTIVSFASDGAAVLMGSVNGVAVRARKRFNARIVVAHCVGHRHALTAVDAATGNLVAETLDTSMAEVVTYHSNSNQRRDHLAKLQESLKIPRLAVLSFVRTRWLCRGQVSARLLTALPALQLEFKADAEANVKTAAALYELTTSYAFVLSLVIFADILRQLNLVSLCFQKEHVRYSDVSRTLASVKKGLDTCYLDRAGFVGGSHYGVFAAAQDTETETFCYRGMTLTFDGEADGRVKAGAVAFAGAVSRGYDDRFPHDKILVALEKFDFTQMPVGEAWDKVKATYGNAEIEVLASHYGYNMSVDGTVYEPQLDPMQLRAEWSAFKNVLQDMKLSGVTLDEGYATLLASNGMPNSKLLAAISLAIVLSTVCCERGFSTMAWVKSKLRNRMSIIMLDALMMIILNGPDMSDAAAVDDLIEKAYDFWAKQAKRTPSRSHPGVARPRKKTAVAQPVHDVLAAVDREAALEARRSEFADCEECHFDPDDGDTGDEGAPSESTGPTITGDDLVQAVGIFPGLEGYEALPKPSGTSEDWKKELKTFKWRGLLLAHVFEGGWATGKYVKKATRRESPNSEVGFYVFYYADVGQYLAHNLGLEEHGDTRSWLILKQAELARLA